MSQGVARLCYAGSVVTTRPDGLMSNRQPRQIGAEIYGCANIGADIEAIELMFASLALTGVTDFCLEIGHIGLFNAMADVAHWPKEARQAAFNALQQKDVPALEHRLPIYRQSGAKAFWLCRCAMVAAMYWCALVKPCPPLMRLQPHWMLCMN